MKRIVSGLIVAGLLSCLLASCGSPSQPSVSTPTTTTTTTTTTTALPPTGPATALISKDRAKQIVITHCGGAIAEATFTKVEVDAEDGKPVYEVEFVWRGTEYEYELNALTGAVLSVEKEPIRTYFDGINSPLTFSSLQEYKEKLLTLTDAASLRWSFVTGGIGESVAIRDEADFAMLLQDGYFLLPVLSKSHTVTQVCFSRDGYTEFSIKSTQGDTLTLTCRHGTAPFDAVEGAERTPLTNTRGVTVTRERRVDEQACVYTWNEEAYACRLSCAADADTFAKSLTFETVTIK